MLCGKALLKRLAGEGPDRLVVIPSLDLPGRIEEGSASFDLHLGTRFAVPKRRDVSHLPAYSEDRHPTDYLNEYYIPFGKKFMIHPHRFVLATTLEWIRLPSTLGGYVVGRSSYGRRGLIIATAVGVHPNFAGVLTLEMTNVGEIAVEVQPGQPICQLFLHSVEDPVETNCDKSPHLASIFPRLRSTSRDGVASFLENLDRPRDSEGRGDAVDKSTQAK